MSTDTSHLPHCDFWQTNFCSSTSSLHRISHVRIAKCEIINNSHFIYRFTSRHEWQKKLNDNEACERVFFCIPFHCVHQNLSECIGLSNFIFASLWFNRTNEINTLRTREASGIKIQATNDQIHSNRYLIISGFIASSILPIHLRACSPTHSHKDGQRCEFDNLFFHWLIFSGIRATIAITWNSIPVYRRIQKIMSIIRLN